MFYFFFEIIASTHHPHLVVRTDVWIELVCVPEPCECVVDKHLNKTRLENKSCGVPLVASSLMIIIMTTTASLTQLLMPPLHGNAIEFIVEIWNDQREMKRKNVERKHTIGLQSSFVVTAALEITHDAMIYGNTRP